jgi:diguanylate cyclase (GGDEF)-like protein/PAS domain S-box-containing protein
MSNTTHKRIFRSPTQIIWLGIGFGIAFWFVDSWINTAYFTSESFFQNLQPTGVELFLRLLVVVQMVLLGYLASRIVADNNRFTSQIADNEERLRLALEAADQGWFDLNLQTGEASISPEFARVLGYDPAEFRSSLQTWQESIHPGDREAVLAAFAAGLKSGGPTSMEYRRRNSMGEWLWINSVGKITGWDEGGQPLRMIGIHTNITARRSMEDTLREQAEFFRLITENGEDFIAVLDLDGKRRYHNPAYARFLGMNQPVKGSDSFAEIHPEDRERIQQLFMDTVHSGVGHRAEFRFVLANGELRHMESCGGLIKNSKGEASCVVVVSHDITERIRAGNAIRTLAFYDPLTNLPNRRLLDDRLNQAFAASKRSGFYGALLFIDLDNFKPLNDEYGHAVGDLLLVEVANRLKNCVREVDTVSRVGGDEFVVMIAELHSEKGESMIQAGVVAEKVLDSLSAPYQLAIRHGGGMGRAVPHQSTASIGVALFGNQEATPEEVIKWADLAMYRAKASGGNLIRFYDPDG